MRKIVLLLVWSIVILGCSNKKEKIPEEIKTETKVEKRTLKKESSAVKISNSTSSSIVFDFLKDINSLSKVKNPIKTFIIQAEKTADKTVVFSKENIQEVLNEATNYSGFVIVVEDHTIIKIDDVKNCKPSGSWRTCMPFAKGFIKKGNLQYLEDYCNFIIGTPNNQKRVAYFFR
jgi:hypothetical protein